MGILSTISPHKVIILILVVGFLLRFVNIDGNPKSMYGDSLTLVYDAYSILKTGQDQTGQYFPLYFSMGGGRPAAYIYSTIPFVAVFGPTALAARAVSALSGLGIITLLYLICSQILSKKIGLFAAFLAAITPWELSLSRGAFESHFALFLGLLGLYLFYKARQKSRWYIASAVSFSLSMQTYATYALTIPLFILVLLYFEGILTNKQKLFKLSSIFFLALILTSLLFSVYISFSRGSKDRFTNLQIFNQPILQNELAVKIKAERAYSLLKPELAETFHNRLIANLGLLSEDFIKNFGLKFLFLQGDGNPRHNPAAMGELFWFCLPLLIIGINNLYKKDKKMLIFFTAWIFIAPIASSLVGEPHAIRASFMLPPLLILAAAGIPKSHHLKFILVIIFLIQLPFFINRFYFLAPNLNASFWSYSAKKATETALENKNKFDYIILSTSMPDMEFAYPVYARLEPKDVIYQNKHKIKLGDYSFSQFNNVYLGSIPTGAVREFVKKLEGSVLYLGPVEDIGMVDNQGIQRDENESALFVISTKNK